MRARSQTTNAGNVDAGVGDQHRLHRCYRDILRLLLILPGDDPRRGVLVARAIALRHHLEVEASGPPT